MKNKTSDIKKTYGYKFYKHYKDFPKWTKDKKRRTMMYKGKFYNVNDIRYILEQIKRLKPKYKTYFKTL